MIDNESVPNIKHNHFKCTYYDLDNQGEDDFTIIMEIENMISNN